MQCSCFFLGNAVEHTLHQIGGDRGRFWWSPALSGWVWSVLARSPLTGELRVGRLVMKSTLVF